MVETALTEHGIDFEQRQRLKLLMEKTLLAYSEIDANAPFRILTHRTYKKLEIHAIIKCEKHDPKEIVDSISIDELLIGMPEPPKWTYRHGENILTFITKTLVPDLEALKNVVHYMDREKIAFRTGVALRFVNMLLLVFEPLLAARIAIENMRGRTVIMVAHRLSTVINCDRLFVVEDGKVIAAGSHTELLESCEAYRQLCGEESVAKATAKGG